MRFFVDHCVPAEIVSRLNGLHGHEAWSAYEAGLHEAPDEDLIAYAHKEHAIAVTNNRDFVRLARRLRSARVVYLRTTDDRLIEAMNFAEEWLRHHALPAGMTLQATAAGTINVLPPLRWR